MYYEVFDRPDGGAVVAREKRVKDGWVYVPVMKFDSRVAATHWVSGQKELEERGNWAGYADPKAEPSVMDQSEDSFQLG